MLKELRARFYFNWRKGLFYASAATVGIVLFNLTRGTLTKPLLVGHLVGAVIILVVTGIDFHPEDPRGYDERR